MILLTTMNKGANSKKRIGILGGSFDPIHYGHLRTALEATRLHDLIRVILVPNNIPPHKTRKDFSSGSARLHMTKLATQGEGAFAVSDFELKNDEPSYTLNTLQHFRKRYGDRLVFILGTDAFCEIATWHEYESLFALADFLVMVRPGAKFPKPGSILPRSVARKFQVQAGTKDGGPQVWRHVSGHVVTETPVTLLDISSSHIRECVKEGCSIRYLTPEPVEKYIRRKKLYR